MEKIVRTPISGNLQTAMLLGLPYEILPNTTQNQALGIIPNFALPEDKYPTAKCYMIGAGGHTYVNGADNIPYAASKPHKPTHGGAFKPIPFVLRRTNDDLTAQQRGKYALRRQETYNGDLYWAYYAKRLDLSVTNIVMQRRTTLNGVIDVVDYVPAEEDLTPVADDLSNTDANNLLSDFITTSAIIDMGLTEDDCTELLNAAVVMRGSDNYAIVSEIQLCSGYDTTIDLSNNTTFKELGCVQVLAHIAALHQIKFTSSGVAGNFDVGTNEPLLTVAED